MDYHFDCSVTLNITFKFDKLEISKIITNVQIFINTVHVITKEIAVYFSLL